jgi:hypothetical protein
MSIGMTSGNSWLSSSHTGVSILPSPYHQSDIPGTMTATLLGRLLLIHGPELTLVHGLLYPLSLLMTQVQQLLHPRYTMRNRVTHIRIPLLAFTQNRLSQHIQQQAIHPFRLVTIRPIRHRTTPPTQQPPPLNPIHYIAAQPTHRHTTATTSPHTTHHTFQLRMRTMICTMMIVKPLVLADHRRATPIETTNADEGSLSYAIMNT